MNNPTQGSRTGMVRQNAQIFPDLPTINTPLTPRQAERAAQFLAMFTPQAAPDVDKSQEQTAPRCRSYEELAAERAERRAKSKAHNRPRKAAPPAAWINRSAAAPEAQESPEERPAWMVTPEEVDAYQKQAATSAAPVLRVQAQPVPELSELLELEQFRPKRGRGYGTQGAGALAVLLDACARRYLAARPHLYNAAGYPPRQVVLHLSAEMLAAYLGVSDNTIREWAAQLQAVGYLQAHAHMTTSTRQGQAVTVADGTLYAVRLAPGHVARLRWADYKKKYRDLDADRKAGRTAHNAIKWAEQRAAMRAEADTDQHAEKNTSESIFTHEGSAARAEILGQIYRWAVIPGDIKADNPLNTDSELFQADELKTVQDVVYLLPALAAAHHTKRAALVGIMAATLARALNDQHSRRYWCSVIWQHWQAELEGRDGLQHLAAQLQRLDIDRREWGELRNPAALFAARQRAV